MKINISMFERPYNINPNADLRPVNLSEKEKRVYQKNEDIEWEPPSKYDKGEHKHEVWIF